MEIKEINQSILEIIERACIVLQRNYLENNIKSSIIFLRGCLYRIDDILEALKKMETKKE